jgi:hypothetical protein
MGIVRCGIPGFGVIGLIEAQPTFHITSTPHTMPSLWSVHDSPSSRLFRIPLPSLPRLGPKARDIGVYTSGALVPLLPPRAAQPLPQCLDANV